MWLIFIGIILLISYGLLKRHYNYFKRHGVAYIKSTPILGTFKDAVLMKKGFYEIVMDIYNHPEMKDEAFYGIFLFHKPAIFIKDPDLIKNILVKDFNSFSDRYAHANDDDPLGENLFHVNNPKWKFIRKKVSPFFTSGKLKAAYYLIEEKGSKFSKFIEQKLDVHGRVELELKKVTDLYSMDSIGSIAFGIDAHSLEGVFDEFQEATHSLFDYTPRRAFEISASFLLPTLLKLFKLSFFGEVYKNFILKFVPDVMGERERSKAKRNDLIDMLIELKNEGEFTPNMIYSQVAVFLTGGYETTSSTISFALYEISKSQDVQQRLREELKSILLENNGEIPYEAIAMPSKMPFLHNVVNEVLRIYAIFPMVDRLCVDINGYSLKPYSDFVIPHGMPVLLPIYPLGFDEKFFSEPWNFNPDRFETVKDLPFCAHIPFGTGPRSCIGERLGLIQVKMAIVKILKDFRIEMNQKTPRKVKLMKEAFSIMSDKPLMVDFVKDPLNF